MKLNEVLYENQQLDEVNWRSLIATGALAAGAGLTPGKLDHTPVKTQSTSGMIANQKQDQTQFADPLLQTVLLKYKHIDPKIAEQIVKYARKYSDKVFPTAKDILAIVGIESSFTPSAVSKLKKDPARGLMQVRPGVWGLNTSDLSTIENQIRIGSQILSDYYSKLNDVDSAIHAYNVGITNFNKKKNLNPQYVEKYKKEKQIYN